MSENSPPEETVTTLEPVPEPVPVTYDTLVMSGGATKGMIHLGAVQSAMDHLLLKDVVNYVGTSAGAMTCYLLAIGYTPIEIMVYICTNRILERMQYFNLVAVINGEGATSFTPIQETLEKMTLDKVGKYLTMKELRDTFHKNLVCATYNRSRKKMEYVSADNYPDLPCLIALRMSASIPLLFDKFRYMGHEYVDGGVADNLPVAEGERIGNKILAITLDPIPDENPEEKDEGLLQYIFSLLYVPITQSTLYRINMATEKSTIIRIPNDSIKFFDFNIKSSTKLNMFSQGYQSFKKLIAEKKE
jgi:NTE family protein